MTLNAADWDKANQRIWTKYLCGEGGLQVYADPQSWALLVDQASQSLAQRNHLDLSQKVHKLQQVYHGSSEGNKTTNADWVTNSSTCLSTS
jgi:hypothetical protein